MAWLQHFGEFSEKIGGINWKSMVPAVELGWEGVGRLEKEGRENWKVLQVSIGTVRLSIEAMEKE